MTQRDDRDDLGRRAVRALTAILGTSQEQAAAKLGVSFTTVNAWANGRRRPRAAHAEALRAAVEAAAADPRDAEARLRAAVALLHLRHGAPRLGNLADPLDELFYILLSLKTSYRTYGDTYADFRRSFRPWRKLLRVSHEEVERRVRRGGLGSIKARAFVDIAARLRKDFGAVSLGRLRGRPDAEVEGYLTSLPGVGIKTARCVMMYSLGRDVVPVDTHTYRVGLRLGIVATSTTPTEAHAEFDAKVPPGLAYDLHTNFVAHGRDLCLDPTPDCAPCPLRGICAHFAKAGATASAPSRRKPRAAGVLDPSRLADGKPRAVDIYAGCGGLSLGLEMGGWRVAYALDWNGPACATHEANFPGTAVRRADVRSASGAEIVKAAGGPPALVAGGPNCQGVSQRGLRSPDDPRNFMFPEFVRVVRELKPPLFLMENVPGLAHRHNFPLLRHIFAAFREIGYSCAADVLLAADYGVPQLRYRFVLVGSSDGMDLSFPAPTHRADAAGELFVRPHLTVADALSDLPEVDASRQRDDPLPYASEPANAYQASMREGSAVARNHVCAATEEINLLRASHVPEGGNWKDIPPDLLPDRFFACRMTDHSTTYARLRRDAPAFTITALFGNVTAGAFAHPTHNRALTVREGARLQSFPDAFVFKGPRNSQYRQIGNAVPPLLGAAVARHLLALARGEKPEAVAPRITEEALDDPRGSDALPILTPRFKRLFGGGTRWPKGWGPEPRDWSEKLTSNYMLRPEFWPARLGKTRRKAV